MGRFHAGTIRRAVRRIQNIECWAKGFVLTMKPMGGKVLGIREGET